MSKMKAFILANDDHEQWSGPSRYDRSTVVGSQRHSVLVMENATRTCTAYVRAGKLFATEMLRVIEIDDDEIKSTMEALEPTINLDEDERILACLGSFEGLLERKFFPGQ